MPRYPRQARLHNAQGYVAEEDDDGTADDALTESPTAPDEIAPIDREIARLEGLVPDHKNLFIKTYPRKLQDSVTLPDLDLSILRPSFRDVDRGFHLSDIELLLWLRSGLVLLSLKRCYDECLSDADHSAELEGIFAQAESPWRNIAIHIAELSEQRLIPDIIGEAPAQSKAIPIFARFVQEIVHVNKFDFFSRLEKKGAFSVRRRSMVGARVLITAYTDLQQNPDGFFGILLSSKLALAMRQDVRVDLERNWILPFEEQSTIIEEAGPDDNEAAPEFSSESTAAPSASVGTINDDIAERGSNKALVRAIVAGDAPGEELGTEFADWYRKWKEDIEQLDREKFAQEEDEAQDPSAEAEQPWTTKAEIPPSELSAYPDLPQGQDTESGYRIEDGRVLKKIGSVWYDVEATMPDQRLSDDPTKVAGILAAPLPPETVKQVFDYENKIVPFSDREQLAFLQVYTATLKDVKRRKRKMQWSELAAVLPGRNHADCIRHYYDKHDVMSLTIKVPRPMYNYSEHGQPEAPEDGSNIGVLAASEAASQLKAVEGSLSTLQQQFAVMKDQLEHDRREHARIRSEAEDTRAKHQKTQERLAARNAELRDLEEILAKERNEHYDQLLKFQEGRDAEAKVEARQKEARDKFQKSQADEISRLKEEPESSRRLNNRRRSRSPGRTEQAGRDGQSYRPRGDWGPRNRERGGHQREERYDDRYRDYRERDYRGGGGRYDRR